MRKAIYIITILIIGYQLVGAQGNEKHLMPGNFYSETVRLFNEQKFHFAQQNFEKIINQKKNYTEDEVESAYYYAALCAIELLNPDAEYQVVKFLTIYPESGKADQIEFEAGRFYYRSKNFVKATEWFEKVKPAQIDKHDNDEYYFSSGYCYFAQDSIEKARLKFYEIKDKSGEYSASSLYYYSHINYNEGNYETALEGFNKLKKDSTFSSISPYYISQILFLQEKYKEVIEFAPSFLEEVTEKRKGEVARIIAESHFNLKQFTEAIPYYAIYAENSTNLTEEDYYQTGYSFYRVEEYQKASESFEKISDSNSSLGQNASYHLADCYIKLGNKQKALIAFSNASKTEFDPRVKEDALFNKAVLNYELSLSPFSESVRDFEEYIKVYPNSARTDEAYNYLTLAYMNTKNYEYAYSSLKKISQPNDGVKKAYQHVAFFRGIELLTNGLNKEAIEKFDVSLKYGIYDKSIKAQTLFWKGEAWYRLEEYNKAIEILKEYVLSTGAFLHKEYQTAHYNLGYCYFKMGKYSDAQVWFRKYVGFDKGTNPQMLADAYNRSGDIAYLKDDYQGAIKFYTGAASLNNIDSDYALFQKATVYGLRGEYHKKIETLQQLLKDYSSSVYCDDALYEAAASYQALNQLDKAENYLNSLIKQYSGSSYEKLALVRLGLIYYNADKPDQAIRVYKQVIASYPGTKESKTALVGLKNIYIDKNNVEKYLSYVNELGGQVTISATEKDSLLFANAENIYYNNDCDNAILKLNDYTTQYGKSPFVKRAWLYLADCYNKKGQKEDALFAFNKVIDLPGNEYNEQALLELSRLNYSMGKYEDAYDNYTALEEIAQTENNILEAQIGGMRCLYKLKRYDKIITSADKVLTHTKINSGFIKEANYYLASSYYELKKYDNAFEIYKKIAENLKTKEGAEAKYRMADILFSKKKYNDSEKVIEDFIKQNSPHQYWVAKSYLLLAEIFMKKEDAFQAKFTVQSIIDYYDVKDDGILASARDIKEKIEKAELKEKEKGETELELHLDK